MREHAGPISSVRLRGTDVTVWPEGDALLIAHDLARHGMIAPRRVPVSNILSLRWFEPTDIKPGYLQLELLGDSSQSGTAYFQFHNRLQFDAAAREDFSRLRDWLEQRIAANRDNGTLRPSLPRFPQCGE